MTSSAPPAIDIDHLRQWVGRVQEREDMVSSATFDRLAALLDYDAAPWPAGLLPPLGHWLAFMAPARQSMLGEDGHPRVGAFMPPVPLPRRMWAGSRVEFHAPARLTALLRQTTTIADVALKSGGTGDFIRLTLRNEVFDGDVLAVREEQDLVYRPPAGQTRLSAPPADKASPPHDYQRAVSPDPTLLFRFSAVTFNAHRIHYDREFAREVEGYPGLVVHGPLQAVLLLDLYLRNATSNGGHGARITRYACRAQQPLFEGAPFTLKGRQTEGGAQLWSEDAQGRTCMSATVEAQ